MSTITSRTMRFPAIGQSVYIAWRNGELREAVGTFEGLATFPSGERVAVLRTERKVEYHLPLSMVEEVVAL